MTDSTAPTDPAMPTSPRGAHLVGSVPLADSEAVFRAAAAALSGRLRRLPDGETGIRTNWIQWQFPLLTAAPQFEPAAEPAGPFGPRLQLRPAAANVAVFPELGYAAAALDSYAVYARLQQAGLIPANVRFQVCLPTPLAVTHLRFIPRDQEVVEDAYEQALLRELELILATVPADQLAIQWDTAVEFAILEGLLESALTNPLEDIIARLVRLGHAVPAPVEVGYHLCYGDVNHSHFIEPADTAKLAAVANGVAAGLSRPLTWLHLPVPRDRADAAYYASLRELRLQPDTELYLGLVHLTDGPAGAQARIAAAQEIVANFGVATECGFGRRPAETIPALLNLHASVSAPL